MRRCLCPGYIRREAIGDHGTGAAHEQAVEDEIAILSPVLQVLETGTGVDVVVDGYGFTALVNMIIILILGLW